MGKLLDDFLNGNLEFENDFDEKTKEALRRNSKIVERKKENNDYSENFFEKNKITKKSNNKYDNDLLNGFVTTGDTISNAFGNYSKGVFSAIEGTTDFLNDIGSQGWNIISNLTKGIKPVSDFAKKMSDTAENIRGVNYTNILTGGGNTAGVGDYANSDFVKNIYKNTNRNYQEQNAGSVLGDTTQGVIEGVGQQLGQFAVSSALGVTNNRLANNALIFSNSYGNAYSNALENGYNKEDARLKALSGGIAETISENLFDMNPLKLKTGGIGDSVTNIVGNSFEKVFRNKTAGRIAVRALGGIGEGIEEPISNILDTAIYGTFKGKSGNEILQEIGDLNEENQQSFVQAMLSTWLVGGGNHLINTKQTNQVISEYAKDNKMSFKEANSIISNSWVYNQTYFLGSSSPIGDGMWHIDSREYPEGTNYRCPSYGDGSCFYYDEHITYTNCSDSGYGVMECYDKYGVRPVIEISTQLFN